VYQQGQAATVTLSVTVSATGALTITKVAVAVAGNTVATWTALPAGTSLSLDLSAPLIL
jgi:hypothetical protein